MAPNIDGACPLIGNHNLTSWKARKNLKRLSAWNWHERSSPWCMRRFTNRESVNIKIDQSTKYNDL